MNEYHKIVTVWERDPETKFKKLLEYKWALPEFEYLKDNIWEYTEKVDGTNIRVIWDGDKVVFGGKTDNAQLYAPLVEWMFGKFYAGALKRIFDVPAILYCEGYGAKIQSGGRYRQDTATVLFDVFCGNKWLSRENVKDVAHKLEIEVVPVVGSGTLINAIDLVRSKSVKSSWGDFMAEGLVCRPKVELLDSRGNRIITKIKVADF